MKAWQDFLAIQEKNLGKQTVDKWLRPLQLVHFDAANLYLEATDHFQLLWFEEHVRPLLKTALRNENFRPIKVHLTVQEGVSPNESRKLKRQKIYDKTTPSLNLIPDTINPILTLEHFIVGASNELVLRFLSGLTSSSPTCALGTFNPIYLWGDPGCGKTHLLTGLTHAFKKQGLNALFTRADTFTEHMICAIRVSQMQAFRKAYRNVDVLIVDDVHVFAKKSATQEEFFHTFNTLHLAGKQVILSAQHAPAHLHDIEARLVSRFEWGINLHLTPLEQSLLPQLLERRLEVLSFPLNTECKQTLLNHFKTLSTLTTALETLVLRCHLSENALLKRHPEHLSPTTLKQLLADLFSQESVPLLTPQKIIQVVSHYYGLRPEDLLGDTQTKEYSLPRHIAMYLCREELGLSFTKIGTLFFRDHSTVMTSIKKIAASKESEDKEILHALVNIRDELKHARMPNLPGLCRPGKAKNARS